MGRWEGSAETSGETSGHLERGGYILRVRGRLWVGSTGSNPLMMDFYVSLVCQIPARWIVLLRAGLRW